MALEELVHDTRPATGTIEPSRAWILGLIVEPDGTMSGPVLDMGLDWATSGMRSADDEPRSGTDTQER